MLKYIPFCAALLVIGAGSLHAQQQETYPPQQLQGESLTRIEVPGADFDIVFATTEPRAVAVIDGSGQIDPLDAGLWPTRVYQVPKGHTLGSPGR